MPNINIALVIKTQSQIVGGTGVKASIIFEPCLGLKFVFACSEIYK